MPASSVRACFVRKWCTVPDVTLEAPHFTLHNALFTLHTWHFTLHTSSHLVWALLKCHLSSSQLFSSHLSTAQLFSSHQALLNSSQLFCTSEHFYCQRESLAHKNRCEHNAFAQRVFLHTDRTHRSFWTQTRLHGKAFTQRCLYTQQLVYVLVCANQFPVLLCTTILAQSTSQYYFVLQNLNKALPNTTLHYKACTKYFPVLLCTTKLAQNTLQYYFVLQSSHRVLPSTYYFVLQNLLKILPSTALHDQTCTKHCPAILCTTSTKYFPEQLWTVKLLHQELFAQNLQHKQAFTHMFFFKQKLLPQKLLHTEAFTHSKLLYTEAFTHTHTRAFTQRSFYTEKLLHTQTSFYTEKLLHREAFTHRSFYTHTHSLLHREAFTHRSFYTQKLLHTEAFTQRSFYKHTQAFTQRSFYTHIYKLLHREAFTHRSFCAQKLLHKEDFAAFTCTIAAETATPNWILVPKRNKDDFEALVSKKKQGTFFNHYNAICSAKWQTQTYLRTWQHNMTTITCSYSNAICNHTFRNTKELRTGEQT